MMRVVKQRAFHGALISVLLLCLCMILPFSAKAEQQHVYDQAGLFTEEQIQSMEQQLSQLSDRYNMGFAVVTTNNAYGMSAADYSRDFFDSNGVGYGSDLRGAMFLIDMDNREEYFAASGAAYDLIGQGEIDGLLDEAYPYLTEGDYYGAAQVFVARVDSYYAEAVSSGAYDPVTGEADIRFTIDVGRALLMGGIGLAVGALVAFFICWRIVRRYKMQTVESAYPFREKKPCSSDPVGGCVLEPRSDQPCDPKQFERGRKPQFTQFRFQPEFWRRRPQVLNEKPGGYAGLFCA